MKITKRIHKIFGELEKLKGEGKEIKQIVGKWQYIYESERGEISLIELPNYLLDNKTLWEIYCLKGGLFDDVERFSSKKEAEKHIKELLKEEE